MRKAKCTLSSASPQLLWKPCAIQHGGEAVHCMSAFGGMQCTPVHTFRSNIPLFFWLVTDPGHTQTFGLVTDGNRYLL